MTEDIKRNLDEVIFRVLSGLESLDINEYTDDERKYIQEVLAYNIKTASEHLMFMKMVNAKAEGTKKVLLNLDGDSISYLDFVASRYNGSKSALVRGLIAQAAQSDVDYETYLKDNNL